MKTNTIHILYILIETDFLDMQRVRDYKKI